MRVAIRFAYDGRFPGHARQPEGGTVEDHLIAALRREGLVDGSWRTGSRTDRGVAAAMNVAACDLDRPHLQGIVPAVQQHLPDGLWITGAAAVEETFDPRRAAWRDYRYHAPAAGEYLDAMQAACRAFVGTHDVTAFARIDGGRDPRRSVLVFDVEAQGDWWVFRVRGQSFLWNQVRRMVDAVLAVGAGRAPAAAIPTALETGEKPAPFGIAPPGGLMLCAVRYEPEPAWEEGRLPGRSVEAFAQEVRVRQVLAEGLMVQRRRRPGDP